MGSEDDVKLTALKTYLEGISNRVRLLFTVNGGAFAIARLIVDKSNSSPILLGSLRLWHLSLGMAIITILIGLDIWIFADIMKRKFLGDIVFHWPGKALIISMSGIIICG